LNIQHIRDLEVGWNLRQQRARRRSSVAGRSE
jgi:hypothetical protein